MIRLVFLLTFAVIILSQNVICDEESEGFVTIIGSNRLKYYEPYKVSVVYQGYKQDKIIQIGIKDSANNKTDSKDVTLSGDGVQLVEFDVTKYPEADYALEIKDVTGGNFEPSSNSSKFLQKPIQKELHSTRKKFSVFIQTDKSVYKPSDLVQFRVFVLDAETKPFKFDEIEIFITDGSDNRIKQYDNPKNAFNRGVYQNQLQLSDLPVLGTWKIYVKVNGASDVIKYFDVDEYVLPKFEVKLDVNPNANFKEGVIRATVKAKYTFGKIAKGNATVTAEVERADYNYADEEPEMVRISKTVPVDGKKFVEFDIKNELEMSEYSYVRFVTLYATFTEELSGKEVKATAKVEIHKTPYKIKLSKSADRIKPGLPFKVTADVRYHDKNALVNDKHKPVSFTVMYYYNAQRTCLRKTTTTRIEEYDCSVMKLYRNWTDVFLKNGMAEIDIKIPENITYIRVKAEYLSNEEDLRRIDRAISESNEYIQARLITERPSLSQKISIQVLSNTEIDHFTYEIFGKGSLVDAKAVKFDKTKNYTLNIQPTMPMIPKAKIIIFYLTKDGEIISDYVEVELGNELSNFINVKLSTEQAKPGEDLKISVDTNPNSFVGLLGVDQSVLLLKKGNDIEQNTVFKELMKFGEIDKYNYQRQYDERKYSNFKSGIVVITNAKKEYRPPYNPYHNDLEKHRIPYGGTANILRGPAPHVSIEEKRTTENPLSYNEITQEEEASATKKQIEIRKEFPETWLFDNLEFDSSNTTKILTKKVPDTITSWVITGFSLNPFSGLGITNQASKLNVFQPFFVSTNLPYSIKRGEVVSIPIIVFNYLENDQQTTVTLFNSDREFEFVEVNDEENSLGTRTKRGLEMERKKEVLVKSNEGVSIPFMIRPLKAVHITIKIIAESPMAGDGVEKQLKVDPEGVPQYFNEAVLIDLRTEREFKKSIDIVVPEEAVPDSTRIEASAIGDILGPSIENLDKLIKLPYGCGEQNMLNFVPNIVVLDYLTSLSKLSPQIEQKAKTYMETGYQRELTYKHNDGSYSAFGGKDNSGSTWLTAFVAKSFNQASKYILIDKNIIKQALDFLTSVQTENGSFPEVGHVLSQEMQGGASKGIALTAYTLITFLEAKEQNEKYKGTIDKALKYILENLDQLEDTYSLAIANYALQLAGHEKKDMLLEKLLTKAENKDGLKYWKKDIPAADKDQDQIYYNRPNSVNVEMSAYGLQALIQAGDKDNKAVPVMKWLVTQRNENGGFQSTQDTVVGLQALSKLAEKVQVADSDIKIIVKPEIESSQPATIYVNEKNSLTLQKHELPSNARHFEVSATGKGFSILQISCRYNLDNSGKYPRFLLNPKVDGTSNKKFLNLHVCTNYVPDSQTQRSNMAVMEVTLPSGFTFDSDSLPNLLDIKKIKKVETKDDDTVIMVYFDDISADEICPEFKAYRTHSVAKQKPAPIIIYDYYDNSRHARAFYNPPEISLCDICDGADECKAACEVPTVEII